MKISISIGSSDSTERDVEVRIKPDELRNLHLCVANPDEWNRSEYYLRRHQLKSDMPKDSVDANNPFRSGEGPKKLGINTHIDILRKKLSSDTKSVKNVGGDTYRTEHNMLAVPISDLVANLLRPCFHKDGIGSQKLFYFKGEPIEKRSYFSLCYYDKPHGTPEVKLNDVQYNLADSSVLDMEGQNLLDKGLVWSAGIVPLVKNSEPLSAAEIAVDDYDIRQILGRDAQGLDYIYDGWYDQWEARVTEATNEHQRQGKPFSVFYHSIIATDKDGQIIIYQKEGSLPALANQLAQQGIVNAGLLDSGGSCALYDVWMGSFLNHGWYYREPRGSIMVFELNSESRLPEDTPSAWINRRSSTLRNSEGNDEEK